MSSRALTLFTTTRPFEGVHAVHQRNALRAWTGMVPSPQVIIIGDDLGARQAAMSLGIDFEPNVRRSASGLPFLSDLFARAQALAQAPVACYSNADIIFPPDFESGLKRVRERFEDFLVIGQRWDVVQDEEVDLTQPATWCAVRDRAHREGVLRGPYWVDYFAFPVGMYADLPDLILGRPGWDNWLVWHTRNRGIPVIDVTDHLTVLHHDHTRSHGPRATRVVPGSDADWNRRIIETESHMYTVGHATHRLSEDGALLPARGAKYLSARVLNKVHPLLRVTRPIRHRLHIEADTAQRLVRRQR